MDRGHSREKEEIRADTEDKGQSREGGMARMTKDGAEERSEEDEGRGRKMKQRKGVKRVRTETGNRARSKCRVET